MNELWTWQPTISEFWSMGGVAIAVFVILGLSEVVKKFGGTQEWSRKTAHMGAGILSLFFPFLFSHITPVMLLCGSFFLIMLLSKSLNLFAGVHGVRRKSFGAFVFPIIIVVIFALAQEPLHFSIPIAVLALADALAALIGKGYGKMHFHTYGEQRSVEGSSAFFITTFLLVHIPLLLLSTTGRVESVLIACGCAILVTCLEIISIRGLDNVFIPLSTWYILDNYAGYSQTELEYRVLFLVLAGIPLLFFSFAHIFTRTGAVAVYLALYASFSLGGMPFLLPSILLILSLVGVAFVQAPKKEMRSPMGISRLFQTIIVSVFVLFVFDNTKQDWLIGPFLAAILTGGGFVYIKVTEAKKSWLLFVILSSLPFLTSLWVMSGALLYVLLWSWGCALLSLKFIEKIDDIKAVFQCVECDKLTFEKRHCSLPAELISGSRWLTEFRLGLIACMTASMFASMGYFFS